MDESASETLGIAQAMTRAMNELAERVFGDADAVRRANEQVPLVLIAPSYARSKTRVEGCKIIIDIPRPYIAIKKFCPKHGDFTKGPIETREDFELVVRRYAELTCPRCLAESAELY